MGVFGHNAEYCLRCGAELPAHSGETLFCSTCGAPQLRLPESLRAAHPELDASLTTGTMPPPRPRLVDWQAVLRCAGLVGAVGAVLLALGMAVDPLDALGTLWLLLSGSIAAWLYRRMRPALLMDSRVGVRVGLAAGLVTVTMTGIVLLAGALISRFALGHAAEMDGWVSRMVGSFVTQVNSQPQGPLLSGGAMALVQSPYGRAGYMLLNFLVDAAFLIVLAAGTGALAGTMVRRRSRIGRTL